VFFDSFGVERWQYLDLVNRILIIEESVENLSSPNKKGYKITDSS